MTAMCDRVTTCPSVPVPPHPPPPPLPHPPPPHAAVPWPHTPHPRTPPTLPHLPTLQPRPTDVLCAVPLYPQYRDGRVNRTGCFHLFQLGVVVPHCSYNLDIYLTPIVCSCWSRQHYLGMYGREGVDVVLHLCCSAFFHHSATQPRCLVPPPELPLPATPTPYP